MPSIYLHIQQQVFVIVSWADDGRWYAHHSTLTHFSWRHGSMYILQSPSKMQVSKKYSHAKLGSKKVRKFFKLWFWVQCGRTLIYLVFILYSSLFLLNSSDFATLGPYESPAGWPKSGIIFISVPSEPAGDYLYIFFWLSCLWQSWK